MSIDEMIADLKHYHGPTPDVIEAIIAKLKAADEYITFACSCALYDEGEPLDEAERLLEAYRNAGKG